MPHDVVLKVKVLPKSPKTEFAGTLEDGTLKVRVNAPPERGKANAELCAFLAKKYGIHRSNVEIITGETSAVKQVRLRGVP
jgi:uncharacterized protein (TIGR00251 family)